MATAWQEVLDGVRSGWYATVILRFVLTALLTGIAGANRRRTAHPAGMRTHMIIGLGSCLLMIVSIDAARLFPNYTGDPSRIAAQVVTGIGFLGAGTIIRLGFSVRGLTTAASVWMCAGVGLALGMGNYYSAIIASLMLYFVLSVVDRLEARMLSKNQFCKLHVSVADSTQNFDAILKILNDYSLEPDHFNISRDLKNNKGSVTIYVTLNSTQIALDIERELSKIEGIKRVSWGRE